MEIARLDDTSASIRCACVTGENKRKSFGLQKRIVMHFASQIKERFPLSRDKFSNMLRGSVVRDVQCPTK